MITLRHHDPVASVSSHTPVAPSLGPIVVGPGIASAGLCRDVAFPIVRGENVDTVWYHPQDNLPWSGFISFSDQVFDHDNSSSKAFASFRWRVSKQRVRSRSDSTHGGLSPFIADAF